MYLSALLQQRESHYNLQNLKEVMKRDREACHLDIDLWIYVNYFQSIARLWRVLSWSWRSRGDEEEETNIVVGRGVVCPILAWEQAPYSWPYYMRREGLCPAVKWLPG